MKMLCNVKLSPHKYKTPEGYLVCQNAILARTGKQQYLKSEIFPGEDSAETVDVDRPFDEVFSQETLASFENKPICCEHPDVDVSPENYNELAVGHVNNIRKSNVDGQDVMIGDLLITDAQCIADIEDGVRTDLSCGYDCDIEKDGDGYKQVNIRGNHVALCEQGRAGIARIVDSKNMSLKEKYLKRLSSTNDLKTLTAIKNAAIDEDKENLSDDDLEEIINFFDKKLEKRVTSKTHRKSTYSDDISTVNHVKDSIGKGTLIQEFGKQGKQYKISKIVENVIYAENLDTGKTVLFKKDEENKEWAVITKSEVKDSLSEDAGFLENKLTKNHCDYVMHNVIERKRSYSPKNVKDVDEVARACEKYDDNYSAKEYKECIIKYNLLKNYIKDAMLSGFKKWLEEVYHMSEEEFNKLTNLEKQEIIKERKAYLLEKDFKDRHYSTHDSKKIKDYGFSYSETIDGEDFDITLYDEDYSSQNSFYPNSFGFGIKNKNLKDNEEVCIDIELSEEYNDYEDGYLAWVNCKVNDEFDEILSKAKIKYRLEDYKSSGLKYISEQEAKDYLKIDDATLSKLVDECKSVIDMDFVFKNVDNERNERYKYRDSKSKDAVTAKIVLKTFYIKNGSIEVSEEDVLTKNYNNVDEAKASLTNTLEKYKAKQGLNEYYELVVNETPIANTADIDKLTKNIKYNLNIRDDDDNAKFAKFYKALFRYLRNIDNDSNIVIDDNSSYYLITLLFKNSEVNIKEISKTVEELSKKYGVSVELKDVYYNYKFEGTSYPLACLFRANNERKTVDGHTEDIKIKDLTYKNLDPRIIDVIKDICGDDVNIDYGGRGENIIVRYKKPISTYLSQANLERILTELSKLGVKVDRRNSTSNKNYLEIWHDSILSNGDIRQFKDSDYSKEFYEKIVKQLEKKLKKLKSQNFEDEKDNNKKLELEKSKSRLISEIEKQIEDYKEKIENLN